MGGTGQEKETIHLPVPASACLPDRGTECCSAEAHSFIRLSAQLTQISECLLSEYCSRGWGCNSEQNLPQSQGGGQ